MQKLIEKLNEEEKGILINVIVGKVYDFCIHQYGCRVIQRIFDFCSEEDKMKLLKEINKE